jgi:hypothetical protein
METTHQPKEESRRIREHQRKEILPLGNRRPAFEQESAMAVFEQVRQVVRLSGGKTTRLSSRAEGPLCGSLLDRSDLPRLCSAQSEFCGGVGKIA